MSDVIHRQKLFGGRETAEQIHAATAWYGLTCSACKGPPALHVRLMALIADFPEEQRALIQFEIGTGKRQRILTTKGYAICTGAMTACSHCAPDLERAAARAPSWCWAEIDRGPGVDNPIVGVSVAL